jgi:glucose-6-phosphate dehydrogenase assembly protein OpcA
MAVVKHTLTLGEQIPIEQIPLALRKQREALARAAHDANALRVCTLNLVAFCNAEERCSETLDVLSAMVVEHPGRLFLVHAHRDDSAPAINARVAVDATPSGPGVPPTYSELIDLDAFGPHLELLAPVLTSLLESDQPAVAWWATPPGFGPTWKRVAQIADRIVVDSGQLDPWDLMRLVEFVKSDTTKVGSDDHAALGDLSWARLKPFMALLAKFFDAPEVREKFSSISRITVRYAAPQGSTTAIGPAMLAAWARGRLIKAAKAARVKTMLQVEIAKVPARGVPAGEVVEVVLAGERNGALELAVMRQEGMLLAEARQGAPALAPQRQRLHTGDRSWLLAQELQTYSRDPLFEKALIDAIDILRDARR